MIARHQRYVLGEKQIVRIWPIYSPDLVDVAEALRRNQRSRSAGPLQHRIDCDSGAVQEQRRLGEARLGLLDAGLYALDQ